ncbi:MAG: SRPBCC family protein [Chloroflexota bacterium]
MNINTNAPVFARKEILIHAPVEKVWQIQSDLGSWPNWQPDIAAVQLDGDLRPGAIFRWKAQGLPITSRVHTVEPERRIGWTGTAPGMYAIHNWTFVPQGDATLAITEESLSGWLTRLMKLFNPRFLEKSLEATLQRLKDRSETR